MSPHKNSDDKTKEGYLLEIEELLNLNENLPRAFYRLSIDNARELRNATLTSGRAGFEVYTKVLNATFPKLNLPVEGIFKNE